MAHRIGVGVSMALGYFPSSSSSTSSSTSVVKEQKPIFVDAIPEHLKCCVCHQLFDKPVQLPRCQHLFCRACIEGWLLEEGYSNCPQCRKQVSINELQKAAVVEECIENLMVCCPNGVTVKNSANPSDLYHVLSKDAELLHCNHRMPKKDLSKHTASCSHGKSAGKTANVAKYEAEIAKLNNQIENLQLSLNRKTAECERLESSSQARRISISRFSSITEDLVRSLPQGSRIMVDSDVFRGISYFDDDILGEFLNLFKYPDVFIVDRNRLYNCVYGIVKHEEKHNDSHSGCYAYASFLINAIRYSGFTENQAACIRRHWFNYVTQTYHYWRS